MAPPLYAIIVCDKYISNQINKRWVELICNVGMLFVEQVLNIKDTQKSPAAGFEPAT